MPPLTLVLRKETHVGRHTWKMGLSVCNGGSIIQMCRYSDMHGLLLSLEATEFKDIYNELLGHSVRQNFE